MMKMIIRYLRLRRCPDQVQRSSVKASLTRLFAPAFPYSLAKPTFMRPYSPSNSTRPSATCSRSRASTLAYSSSDSITAYQAQFACLNPHVRCLHCPISSMACRCAISVRLLNFHDAHCHDYFHERSRDLNFAPATSPVSG